MLLMGNCPAMLWMCAMLSQCLTLSQSPTALLKHRYHPPLVTGLQSPQANPHPHKASRVCQGQSLLTWPMLGRCMDLPCVPECGDGDAVKGPTQSLAASMYLEGSYRSTHQLYRVFNDASTRSRCEQTTLETALVFWFLSHFRVEVPMMPT